jgi:hypothetical protein
MKAAADDLGKVALSFFRSCLVALVLKGAEVVEQPLGVKKFVAYFGDLKCGWGFRPLIRGWHCGVVLPM